MLEEDLKGGAHIVLQCRGLCVNCKGDVLAFNAGEWDTYVGESGVLCLHLSSQESSYSEL